jgi:predicted CoA-binding protein
VERFVAEPALAIVGVSRSGAKFGNAAARELAAKGYRVYPVHPGVEEIDGFHCYPSFEALPEHVNAVLVVVPPAEAVKVVRDAAKAGIHQVWLQQGAESEDVLAACRTLNLSVVSGECILMFAKPASFHRLHGWIRRVLGHRPHEATTV